MLLLRLHALVYHLLLSLHLHLALGLHLLLHLLLFGFCIDGGNQRADGAHLVDVQIIKIWKHFRHFLRTYLRLNDVGLLLLLPRLSTRPKLRQFDIQVHSKTILIGSDVVLRIRNQPQSQVELIPAQMRRTRAGGNDPYLFENVDRQPRPLEEAHSLLATDAAFLVARSLRPEVRVESVLSTLERNLDLFLLHRRHSHHGWSSLCHLLHWRLRLKAHPVRLRH